MLLAVCITCDFVGQGATVKSSFERHKTGPVNHKSTDMLSDQQLLQLASFPSSVFIIFHNGWPLVVYRNAASTGIKHLGTARLVKLHYSAVESFLTSSNLIYLGTSESLSDSEMSTNGEMLDKNSDQSSVAYFCVDLNSLLTDEVTGLCGDQVKTELLHPLNFLQLSTEDRMLYSRASPILDWHRKNRFCPACGSATSVVHGGYKTLCQNNDCLTHKGCIFC